MINHSEVVAVRDEAGEKIFLVVYHQGGWLRVCTPTWRKRGPALAYAKAIETGKREPEFSL